MKYTVRRLTRFWNRVCVLESGWAKSERKRESSPPHMTGTGWQPTV